MAQLKYGWYESHPCVFSDTEAWVCWDDKKWTKVNAFDVHAWAGLMTEQTFKSYDLPPLPKEAFR